MRKVPAKNYVFCILLVGITVVLTYYLCSTFNHQQSKVYTSTMYQFLTEIKEDDIEDYLVENATVVLYIGDKTDSTLEEKEEDLKNFLSSKNLQQYFVYLDVSENKETGLKNFQEKHEISLNYDQLPIFIAVIDGEIKEIYADAESTSDVEKFLIRNEVIDND